MEKQTNTDNNGLPITMASMTLHYVKPLFIPLKKRFFEEFGRGEKRIEFRVWGKRWNEKTCHRGRKVVLSCGYGKQRRLYSEIASTFSRPLSYFCAGKLNLFKSLFPYLKENDLILEIVFAAISKTKKEDGGDNE